MEAKALPVRFPFNFFTIMAIGLVAIVVFGFSQTVPSDFATPGFPPFLVVHGLVFASWMVLFVAQPTLVGAGAIGVHRKLGWLGLAIAVAMVLLGGVAVLMGLISGHVPPFYPPGLFLMRGSIGLLTFIGLVIAAIVNRRRSQWHKRLLLCATVIVTIPAFERALPIPLFGTGWPFVVDGIVDLILLIGPIVDLVTRKRVHPAYLVGIGAILFGQAATDLLAPSPIVATLLHTLGVH